MRKPEDLRVIEDREAVRRGLEQFAATLGVHPSSMSTTLFEWSEPDLMLTVGQYDIIQVPREPPTFQVIRADMPRGISADPGDYTEVVVGDYPHLWLAVQAVEGDAVRVLADECLESQAFDWFNPEEEEIPN